jgi:hypothetical protein
MRLDPLRLTEWMEKKKRKKELGPIPTGADWKEYLSRDNAFTSWVAGNIKAMAISIHSMPPLNHVDETSGAQCPSNFCIKNPIWNWNPNQVLENQDNDDVFRLVTFDNGDYACMGTLQLTDPVIVDNAKKDTQVIPTCGYAKRRGVSGGFHYPAEKGAICSSFSKACATFNKVDIKPTSHSTGLKVTYWNVDKNKRVNNVSCYRDVHMVRNTKHRKYSLVMKDVNLQAKMIKEMKSRLLFLLILLENQLEHPHNLFLTFAQAVVRVQNNNMLWPGHNNFERALLEYACGTAGEMKNFQQLYCHKDGNESHLVETMTVFG